VIALLVEAIREIQSEMVLAAIVLTSRWCRADIGAFEYGSVCDSDVCLPWDWNSSRLL
jgi:hypothetical protein